MVRYADARWNGPHGIGRYSYELTKRLEGFELIKDLGTRMSPFDPIELYTYLRSQKASFFYSPGPSIPVINSGRVAVTIHDLMLLDVPGEVSKIKKIYFKQLLRKLYRRADMVFTVSEYSKARLSEWLMRDDITVIGNGVSEDFFYSDVEESPSQPPYFLYVGNRRNHKNFTGVLKAFSIFCAAQGLGEKFNLHVTGIETKKCHDRNRSLGISGRVRYLGDHLTDTKLADQYRNSVCLLIPSFDEGFGMPALEAMACGTPVISSACGALKEVVGSAGLLIDPYEVDSISEMMLKLASTSSMRESAKRLGLLQAKKYSWRKSSKLLNEKLSEFI